MIRALLLSIVLAGAPVGERVRVEADEIGIMTKRRLDEIAAQATKLAEEAGIAPDQMSVSLVWADRDALVYGIRVRIETDAAKVVDPDDLRGPIVQNCSRCNEADLVTASIEGVLAALQRYKKAKEPPPPEPRKAAVVQEDSVPAAPATKQPEADRPGGLGTMGKVGVAGIVIGSAAVITGGALVGVGTTRPDADPTKLVDWWPSGYALIGVGAAVLVTGVALLAVDRKKAKRKVAGAPVLMPSFAGVVVEARF
jgi:hypothetical protein